MPDCMRAGFQFRKARYPTGLQAISLVDVIKERFSVSDHS